MISFGLVNNLSAEIEFFVKIISDPIVNKIANKEKIIKFKNKLKFPNCISFLSFAYLEKSPKLRTSIEKYVNMVPDT